jgi:hypothetical protein
MIILCILIHKMGGVWFSFFWKKDVAKAQTPFASSFLS